MGEHQLDVPRSIGGRYVEAWQIYLSGKRNIKMVMKMVGAKKVHLPVLVEKDEEGFLW